MKSALIAIAAFAAGIICGMLAQPAKFNKALEALQAENQALREVNVLQQKQLDEINAVLRE